MSRRVVLLGAVYWPNLKDALETAREHLFIELGALAQESLALEVGNGEKCGAALGRGRYDFWRVHLNEPL